MVQCTSYSYRLQEVYHNILIECGIPMKLVGLIKMNLNETYSKVCTGKLLSCVYTIQNSLKQIFYCHCFSALL